MSGSPIILFVTFSKRGKDRFFSDPSVIYRCFNVASETRRAGFPSYVAHVENLPYNLHPDIVIFHRPYLGTALEAALKRYSSAIKVADYDDLLFDPASIDSHPALLSRQMSEQALKKEVNKYVQGAQPFDVFSLSSPVLKPYIEKMTQAKTIINVRNGINPDWLAYGRHAEAKPPAGKRVISYFSGTANHQADLDMVEDQLNEFLAISPQVIIRIFGAIRPKKNLHSDRWQVLDPVPFIHLPKLIKQSWVAIAPLVNNPFNACKSAIKFLESGAFSVPLVASPLAEFGPLENAGLIVTKEQDWVETLNNLKEKDVHQQAKIEATKTASTQIAKTNCKSLIQWLGAQ